MNSLAYFCTRCGNLLDKDTLKLRRLPYDGIEVTCKNCGKVVETCYPGDYL